MRQTQIVLCEPARTAIATSGGSLGNTPGDRARSHGDAASFARAAIAPNLVETAVMADVIQAGANMSPARQAAIGRGSRSPRARAPVYLCFRLLYPKGIQNVQLELTLRAGAIRHHLGPLPVDVRRIRGQPCWTG